MAHALILTIVICLPFRATNFKTKGNVFRYMWVYAKEDTMAHTYRSVVTS